MAKIKFPIKPSPVITEPEEDKDTATVEEEPKIEKEKVLVRCPDCPWKAGLKDESTYCGTCNGSGQVPADPLE